MWLTVSYQRTGRFPEHSQTTVRAMPSLTDTGPWPPGKADVDPGPTEAANYIGNAAYITLSSVNCLFTVCIGEILGPTVPHL